MKFRPEDFPRLREFARGYLHQDMLREYGSAEQAARAYWADLKEEEREEVQAEAVRFGALTRASPWEEIDEALMNLGAAWRPRSKDEWIVVNEVLLGTASNLDGR